MWVTRQAAEFIVTIQPYLNLNDVLVHDNRCGQAASTKSRGGGIFFGTGEGSTGSFPASFVLNVNDSQIYGNSAVSGGGVYNAATMNIMRSLVRAKYCGIFRRKCL